MIAARAVLMTMLLAGANLGPAGGDDQGRRPQSDAELRRWLENMLWYHRFTYDEIQAATGMPRAEAEAAIQKFGLKHSKRPERPAGGPLLVLPYPGGRHPRIGFLDGAVDPQRETKVSVFTPWDPESYVVVDVPEAIFTNLGLTYLAHTHVPTIWTERGVRLQRQEWAEDANGTLTLTRALPNGITFGSRVVPLNDGARMELTLTNGTQAPLTGMRVQVCVMLKGARGFNDQTNDNKVIRGPFVAVRDHGGKRWVATAWRPLNRAWANPPVPCLHSDPALPDCAPGETVKAEGRLWLLEADDAEAMFKRLESSWGRDAECG